MNLRRNGTNRRNEYDYRISQRAPSQYLEYRYEPKSFMKKITTWNDKGVNPLYSLHSFSKYFNKKKKQKSHKLRKGVISNKQGSSETNEHVEGIKNLLKDMKIIRNNYPTTQMYHKIDILEEFAEKSKMHFQNLNLEEGFVPGSPFSRQNLKIKQYLKDIIKPRTVARGKTLSSSEQAKRKAHTQNITQYLREAVIESRYLKVPKQFKNESENDVDIESCQKNNRELRNKTEYCQMKYQPPMLMKKKVDEEILGESRRYMSQLSHTRDRSK